MAIKGWTKKEWRIENQILTPKGFDKIKTELKKTPIWNRRVFTCRTQ